MIQMKKKSLIRNPEEAPTENRTSHAVLPPHPPADPIKRVPETPAVQPGER